MTRKGSDTPAPRRRLSLRRALPGALALLLASCSSDPSTVRPRSPTAEHAEGWTGPLGSPSRTRHELQAVWARAAYPLLVPFDPTPAQIAAGSIPARLDRGQSLSASLFWITTTPSSSGLRAERGSQTSATAELWVGVTKPAAADGWEWIAGERWTATSATSATRPWDVPQRPGRWVAILDLPRDAFAQGIRLSDRQLNLGWLADPPFDSGAARQPSAPGPALTAPWYQGALAAQRLSPLSRWRARLATGELGERLPPPAAPIGAVVRAPASSDPAAAPPSALPADLVIEHLARQVEYDWAAALDRLAAADPDLALRVKRRLVHAVEFEPGLWAPAWPTDALALSSLRADLLATDLTPVERTARAREWLDAQSPAAAWVTSDAAESATMNADQPASPPAALISVADLRPPDEGHPSTAWAAARTSTGPGQVATLNPATAQVIRWPVPSSDRASAHSVEATIRIGAWTGERSIVAGALAASPPGLRIGPLTVDWTLSRWLTLCAAPQERGAALSTPEASLTARSPEPRAFGLLYKSDASPSAAPDPARRIAPQGWVLYFELDNVSAPAEPVSDDELRITFGPHGARSHTLRIFPDGRMIRDPVSTLANPAAPPERITTTRTPSGWACWIPLPHDASDSRGQLTLGIQRFGPSGRRWSWPRPMMPWQTEPARVLITLAEWSGLK